MSRVNPPVDDGAVLKQIVPKTREGYVAEYAMDYAGQLGRYELPVDTSAARDAVPLDVDELLKALDGDVW